MGTQEEMVAEIKSLRKRVKDLEERLAKGQDVEGQLSAVNVRLEKLEEKLKAEASGEEGPLFGGLFEDERAES